MSDASFREFFEKECHVCSNTVRIFEKMDRDRLSIETVASILQVDPQSLQKLMDADYCDPELVIRLCRQLDLPIPQDCPRKASDQ
jgi:predicted DCC family thiol-disulfide oxidoreductase YuxK